MIDNYHILAVGSGPNLLKIRKNDGQINEKIFLGGSHHNAFDYILKGESKKYYFLGGESKKLIFFHYYELKKKQERLVQEFDTFS